MTNRKRFPACKTGPIEPTSRRPFATGDVSGPRKKNDSACSWDLRVVLPGSQRDEEVLQRWSDRVDVGLRDAGAAELAADGLFRQALFDEQVHRLAEDGCIAHARESAQGLQTGGDVIAGNIEAARAGRVDDGQRLEIVGHASNDEPGRVDVADVGTS